MSSVEVQITQLAKPAPAQLDSAAFLRDNFFNTSAQEARPTKSTREERLTATTPFNTIFGHIIRVEGIPYNDTVQEYIDMCYLNYRALKQPVEPLEQGSRLENLLISFDEFLFDRYGPTFEVQSEQTANFGRFTVRQAIRQTALEHVS